MQPLAELVETSTEGAMRIHDSLKPRTGPYHPLIPRWSCSIRLFRYWFVRCFTPSSSSVRIARG